MKLKGLNGNQFLLVQQSIGRNKLSTRFSDRTLYKGTLEERLKMLKRRISTEIAIVSPYLLTLEGLATRYYEDGALALREGEVAYYNQYHIGYEKAKVIIDHSYRCLPDVI